VFLGGREGGHDQSRDDESDFILDAFPEHDISLYNRDVCYDGRYVTCYGGMQPMEGYEET